MLFPELALLLLGLVPDGEPEDELGSDPPPVEVTDGGLDFELGFTVDMLKAPGDDSGSRPMDIALASVYVSPGSFVTSKYAQCGTAVPLGMV